MEFDSALTKIQGILLSQEKSLGDLKKVKIGDEDAVTVVEAMKKGIEQIFKTQNSDVTKRKIHLYLLLNTDFAIQKHLSEDDNIAHLINSTATISPELLVSIIRGCGLLPYMCEVLTFGEPSLGVEYLAVLLLKSEDLNCEEYIEETFQFISAIFLRIVRLCKGIEKCNNSTQTYILNKFYAIHKTILDGIMTRTTKKLYEVDKTRMIELSGKLMKDIIYLVVKCIGYMEDPSRVGWYPELSIVDCDYSAWSEGDTEVDILKAFDLVVAECTKHIQNISINKWIEWENCPGSNEDRHLQSEIAEAAYICTNKKSSIISERLQELKAILMGFESKPIDEADEINISDVPKIISCIHDESKTRNLWLQALVKKRDGLSTIEGIEAVRNHMNLLDTDTTYLLMQAAMKGRSADDSLLIETAYEAFINTPIIDQPKLLEDIFRCHKLNDKFKSHNFDATLTSVLNRSANLQTRREKWLPELLALCLQSPVELVKRIVMAGVMSRGQGTLMCSALEELKPICNMDVETEECNSKLLVHALNETMATIDPATSQITHFVSLLEEKELVSTADIVCLCVIPALHRDLAEYKVPHIQHWLQLLRKLMKVDIPMFLALQPGINLAAILGILADVLQKASWVLGKFRQQESLLRADTVLLVRPLACRLANCSEPDDKELQWLRSGLLKLTSHNRSHFSSLWTHFGMPVPSMNLGALLLSRDAMCQQSSMPPGGPDQLLSPLLILLPTCCTPEWRMLASTLSALQAYHSNANIAEADEEEEITACTEDHMLPDVLRLLVTTLMLQALMLSQPQPDDHAFSNDCALACLENSVRNLGIVMKEEWLPRLSGIEVVEVGAGVVRQVALLLRSLPASLAGSCSLALSGVLIQAQEVLLVQAAPRPELATWCAHELALSLALLPDRESRQALSRKLLLEPALAQL